MDLRVPSRSRTAAKTAAILIAWLVIVSCSHRPPEPSLTVEQDAWQSEPRPVYRYSVIPGGVRSAEELKAKLADDPVAKHHYAGFDQNRSQNGPLFSGGRYYISYRKDERIFWTKAAVSLPAGEAVLQDLNGNLARVRCGNRLSQHAQYPVAMGEPTPAELDTIIEYVPEIEAAQELPAVKDLPPVTYQPPKQLAWTPNPAPMIPELGTASHRFFGDSPMSGGTQIMPGKASDTVAPVPAPGRDNPAPATPFDPLPVLIDVPGTGAEVALPPLGESPDPALPSPAPPTEVPGMAPPCCDVVPTNPDQPKPFVPDDPKYLVPQPPTDPVVPDVPEPHTMLLAGVGLVLIAWGRRGR